MTKDEYTKRLEEILLTYGGYCSQQVEATDGDKQFFEAITAIQQLNNEAIGETEIQVRGITQNKENPMYWTKSTKVDYELRQELKAVIGDDK